MKLKTTFVPALALLLLAASSLPARIWSDSTGKYSVEAELIEVRDGKVVLQKPTGAKVTVPLSRLSATDKKYLQSLEKSLESGREPNPSKPLMDAPQDDAFATKLKTGSIVSIHANADPVNIVLNQIENETGNWVRVVDRFGREDRQLLSKSVSLDVSKKPFWDAVAAVAGAAEVEFRSLNGGVLELASWKPHLARIKMIGAPVTTGAFQIYAGFDEMFGQAMIVLRTEPRIANPQVQSFRFMLTLPDGKQVRYQPKLNRMSVDYDIHTGELVLGIGRNHPKGIKQAKAIRVAVQLAVPSASNEFTLPPLGQLVGTSVRVGTTSVRIAKAEMSKQPDGSEDFQVRLEFDEFPASREQIALVGADGRPLRARGWSGAFNTVSLAFDPARIPGKAESCRLRLEMPTKVTEHVVQATFNDVPLAK